MEQLEQSEREAGRRRYRTTQSKITEKGTALKGGRNEKPVKATENSSKRERIVREGETEAKLREKEDISAKSQNRDSAEKGEGTKCTK